MITILAGTILDAASIRFRVGGDRSNCYDWDGTMTNGARPRPTSGRLFSRGAISQCQCAQLPIWK